MNFLQDSTIAQFFLEEIDPENFESNEEKNQCFQEIYEKLGQISKDFENNLIKNKNQFQTRAFKNTEEYLNFHKETMFSFASSLTLYGGIEELSRICNRYLHEKISTPIIITTDCLSPKNIFEVDSFHSKAHILDQNSILLENIDFYNVLDCGSYFNLIVKNILRKYPSKLFWLD